MSDRTVKPSLGDDLEDVAGLLPDATSSERGHDHGERRAPAAGAASTRTKRFADHASVARRPSRRSCAAPSSSGVVVAGSSRATMRPR